MPPATTEIVLNSNSSVVKNNIEICQETSNPIEDNELPTTAIKRTLLCENGISNKNENDGLLKHRKPNNSILNNNNNEAELNKSDENSIKNNININNSNIKNNTNNNVNKNNNEPENYLAAEELDYNESLKAAGEEYKPMIRWPDFIVQVLLHTGCVYGLYLLAFVKVQSLLWFIVLILGSGFGITAGAHRLWSHRSYKARLPLRLILIFLFTIAGQRDAYTWALDHRIHHKFSETDADPHNAKRGFFFAHVGWLFLTPHPRVIEKRKVIDMSDLEADQVVVWQRRLYIPLFALITIGMPVAVPYYFWNENLWLTFWTHFVCRFVIVLNIAFFVNSVAHMFGQKPYDKKISPTESLPVAIIALGEGWHNYHHVFPWDYKTGEFGEYKFNISTAFIDFFTKIGWAYDRKLVSSDMIARRAAKCGDGTHFLNDAFAHKDAVWGYGDKDIPKEDALELEKMNLHN